MTGTDALRAVLSEALRSDPAVRLLGEAVDFLPATRGLRAEFPGRVHLLPAADATLVGLAVGMAWGGARPVVELADARALWAVVPHLGDLAPGSLAGGEREGGRSPPLARAEFPVRMVVRVPISPGDPEIAALVDALDGMVVACSSSPEDAAALLRGALDADGPVVLLEPRSVLSRPAVPGDGSDLPFGRARILREGEHATVLAWGEGVRAAVGAAEGLAGDGVSVEVVDLRTLCPIDAGTVGESVGRTGRVVVAGGSFRTLAGAVGAGFLRLESPPATCPADAARVAEAVRQAVDY